MFGDYESLSLGCAVDALVDFTSGVADRHEISEDDGQNESTCLMVYKMLEESLANNALIVAEIRVEVSEENIGSWFMYNHQSFAL